VLQYAAAAAAAALAGVSVGVGATSPSHLYPSYPLGLAALAAAHTKSSSIADLRLKAKRHAEAIAARNKAL